MSHNTSDNTPLRAIEPDANTTVMASAGTGKTYLLVSRLVRLLLEGVSPDAVLAITFTRKAAAEMQERLRLRLLDLACADDAQLAEQLQQLGLEANSEQQERARQLYEQLLSAPSDVKTTTFHAFCQDILRRFPLESAIPPGFELAESTGELEDAAWEALFAEATLRPEGPLASALSKLFEFCGSLDNTQTALNNFLNYRCDWWSYTQDDSDPIDASRQRLQTRLAVETDVDPYAQFFSPQRWEQLKDFSRLLGKHLNKTNQGFIDSLMQAFETETANPHNFGLIHGVFLTQKGEPRSRKSSKAQMDKMGEEGEAQFLLLHQQCCQALQTTQEQLAALDTYQASSAWYLAGDRYLQHYQRLKAEQRLLDFNDLEWKVYQLLNRADNALWVQYKLDQRIDHLLVDEFQDTNPTQWRLLLPLLEEMAQSRSERLRSVFLVGDSKQSIYRFRRADPSLFYRARDWMESAMAANTAPLATSYRSASAIMEMVNALFSLPALHSLIDDFPLHTTHHQGLWGEVRLLPLIRASVGESAQEDSTASLRNPLLQPRKLELDDRHFREGQAIASEIQTLIDTPVLIGSKETARTINYSDILILVRRRTHVGELERALREADIPYLGSNKGTLLESQEAQDMVALLNTLTTPFNNLSLAGVLRSPLFACSNEALVTLAQSAGKNWWEKLMALPTTETQDQGLATAALWLRRWHTLAGQIPVHDLLDHIYHQGDLIARYAQAYPTHLQGRAEANLTRFLELALEIDAGRYPSLVRFLLRLQRLRYRQDEAPDEASGRGESRVRILTIHAAKGLEAPVVFLLDTAAKAQNRYAYKALIHWPAESNKPEQFLLSGKKASLPTHCQALLAEEEAAERREEANLLYVAITRARQLLYLSACENQNEELGWYGLARQCIEPEPSVDEHSCLFRSASMPQQAAVTTSTTPPQVPPLPALARQQPAVEDHAIAPSRHLDTWQQGHDGDDEDGRLRGIIIHKMLQGASEGEERQQICQLVSQQSGIDENNSLIEPCWQEVTRLLSNEALAFLFAPQHYELAYNELPISYENAQGQHVYGLIDRIVIQASSLYLIDYKTHHHANSDNIAEIASRYQTQMDLYAQGLRQIWPQHRIQCLLLFTAPGLVYELNL